MNDPSYPQAETVGVTAGSRQLFSPRDLVLSGKWSSALFMTYSLSLSFFEAVPFSGMSRTVRDVTVLADVAGYGASLSEAGALGAGRNYEVIPISVDGGVFHPKVAVLIERNGPIRAMVGSGNLTFGGWGYNAEVVDVLVPGPDARAYADLAAFLAALADLTGPGDPLTASRKPDIAVYVEACIAQSRRAGDGSSRLLHTLSGPSLAVQIAGMASELGGALSLTVVSPFFSGHHGVARLASELRCGAIAVAVPLDAPSYFDFAAARSAGFNASPVICDEFSDSRSLHAKVFDIECRNGRLHISGSANATIPALVGHNVEAVVARVVGRSRLLGWRATAPRAPTAASGETGHDGVSPPCLAAHFNGRKIQGLLFGVSHPEGKWSASLRCGSRTEQLPQGVMVARSGVFQFVPESCDPAGFPSAAQLVLERHDSEARGWLMQGDLLRAISAKGPIARAIAHMLGRDGVTADVIAVLEFFAKSPGSLIEAADRQGGGRVDREPRAAVPPPPIGADKIQPIGAFQTPSIWTGDGGSVAFDNLLDALVRHFAVAMPESGDGDDEEEDLPSSAIGANGPTVQRKREQVPDDLFRTAFDRMAAMLATVPSGPARVPGLHALFDMVVQITPRCEEPEALTLYCLKAWLELARGCRGDGAVVDALDRSVALVLAKWSMDGAHTAEACHARLQGWFGKLLDAATLRDLEPDPDNPERWDERRLAPNATAEGWRAAWRTMISTVTPWSKMHVLCDALKGGGPWEPLAGMMPNEVALLQRIANGRSKPNRMAIVTGQPGKVAFCPGCHMELPLGEQFRLRAHRIATCRSCQRVLLDLSI